MGEEIKNSRFSSEDFDKFSGALRDETKFLLKCFDEKRFANEPPMVGLELETWLIDPKFNPAPVNQEFLNNYKNPAVVHELSRFNLELNTSPYEIHGEVFSDLQKEISALWKECDFVGKKLDTEMIMIGILPTLRQEMLSMANISTSQRYLALNEQVLAQRKGEPLRLDIQGKDHLSLTHPNVMLEATATSLQIHVNVPTDQQASFYNAALIISAPMIAISANSPYLFQKELWEETRIPVFEQAVDLNHFLDAENYPVGRVTFGTGYLKDSFRELFEENLDKYPILLPFGFEDPLEKIRHLKLHNGTIWRWNRPLIGDSSDGRLHLRLEHRVCPAGPSIPDVVANIAFFVGLLYGVGEQKESWEKNISHHSARENFYRAARLGLGSRISWLHGKKREMNDLIHNDLIPLAQRGLEKLGVKSSEIKFYLEDIIKHRVLSGQNGAQWQKDWIKKNGPDFRGLTESYVKAQRKGRPVHEWSK